MMTHCPMCGYSLEGLPEKHLCPECAYEYDRSGTAVVPPKQSKMLRLGFYASLAGLTIFAFLYWYFPGRFSLMPGIFFSSMLIGSFRRHRDTEGAAIIVYPDRVDDIRNRIVVKSHSLIGIDRASWTIVDGRIRLRREGRVVWSFKLDSRIYPNKSSRQLVAAIQQHISIAPATRAHKRDVSEPSAARVGFNQR